MCNEQGRGGKVQGEGDVSSAAEITNPRELWIFGWFGDFVLLSCCLRKQLGFFIGNYLLSSDKKYITKTE